MRRCRLESLGVSPPHNGLLRWGSVRHAVTAGRRCLAASRYQRQDVGVLVNAGVNRDGHTCEPAMACYIQHRLGINTEFHGRRTLAFDLLNGGTGMLNAVHVVTAVLSSGQAQVGLAVASEVNADRRPDPDSTIVPSGVAVLLDISPTTGSGFGAFAFVTHEEGSELRTAVVSLKEKSGRLFLRRAGELEKAYLGVAAEAFDEVLRREGLARRDVTRIVPAQVSATFLGLLPAALEVPREKIVDLTAELPDTLTTSVFLALDREQRRRRFGPEDVVVLLAVGSGVTAGAAVYRF